MGNSAPANRPRSKSQPLSSPLMDQHMQDLNAEIDVFRAKLKAGEIITFTTPMVFIFFGPPEYATVHAAEYLATKTALPVLYSSDFQIDLAGQKITQSNHQNVSTQKLLRRSSSIHESSTRKNLISRISQSDCSRGFILYEYPDTIGEMRHFKESIVPHMRVEIIHLQLDNETMRNLLNKFDRWVHEPSGRSYHLRVNPPQSFVSSLERPRVENMLDDETGEPLIQLPQDTVEHYKNRLHMYEIREVPMYYEFQECSHIVIGGAAEKDVHRSILKTVYNIRINEIKSKYTLTIESLKLQTSTSP